MALKNYFGNDKVLNIGTFKTEGTKSAILSACRGYRSEEFPQGIEIDTAQYLSSLIPQERGKLWSIQDVVYGNKEKERKPSREFINEIKKYEGLLDIIVKIDGLVCGRSIHASGIYITNDSYIKTNAMMKAPNGQETSQFDMADSDYQGNIKFDALTIEALDIIQKCIELLIKDGYIEEKATLKETYESVIGPNMLTDRKEYWDIAAQRKMLSCFQFDTAVGSDAIAKIQPDNIIDAMQANSLMRLMASEKGAEMPLDKFVRYKNNINLWYKEMEDYRLTKEEQHILEKYLKEIYGVASTQEDLMKIVMDKDISNFDIIEANKLRKAIAKKKANLMEEVKELFYKKCKENKTSKNLADYIWHEIAMPQAGYSFSCIHTLSYSTIALQELMLYKNYPSIYWNTAVLLVNSASVEEFINEDFIEKQYDEEGNEIEEKEKKAQNVNYDKIAKALGEIIKAGIVVTPPMINTSNREFTPDAKNNRILYSLKALSGVGDKEIEQIIKNRPYLSLNDFLEKNNIKKPAVISLIKAGAFDELENKNRVDIMKNYIVTISNIKKVLNMRNFQALMRNSLLPSELTYQCKLFEFNRYIRQKQFKRDGKLFLDTRAQAFLLNNYSDIYDNGILENDFLVINEKEWKKIYDKDMLKAKQYIIDNQEALLNKYNALLIKEQWDKYCLGNISKWEMDSMSFYYHKHELAHVDLQKYGINEFSKLPEEPEIERFFEIKNRQIPIYKINKIIGTCIGKNNIKGTFTLLTSDGEVVDIRLTKEHFAYYNKQISEIENGVKKVKEKSWFTRGTKLMVVGIRRGSGFMAKKYKNTGGHRLYKINDVINNGKDLIITSSRYGTE